MFFDYISDIHLDFWVKLDHNERKSNQKIRDFVSNLLPDKPQEVLVIAGDLGHYLHQNKTMILYLREVYKTIFYVFGNHDYYLLSNQMKKTYGNSQGKVDKMEKMLSEIDGVIRLNGDVHEISGIRFSGADMWYDFSYGKTYLGQTEEEVLRHWWDVSNDRVFISGLEDTVARAEEEKQKAKDLVCDVFVSHVPPIGIPLNDRYAEEKDLSFYTFNAEGIFSKQKPSVWVSGHMHQQVVSEWNGMQMLVNALGYPEPKQVSPSKIASYRNL